MRTILAQNKHVNEIVQLLTKHYVESLTTAKKYVSLKIKRKECFVSTEGKTIIGFLIFTREYSHDAHTIEYIIVREESRRKGIAKQLLEKYISTCRKEQPKKQPYALSSAEATNKVSIRMHKQFGFVEIGRLRKLHYGKDEIFFGYKLR